MINVSEGWIEAHKGTLLPETFIEVTYMASEPGLQQEARAECNLETAFSEGMTLTSTLDRGSEKYNSLEWNLWGLDGSFTYFDGSPVSPGYVTANLSGEAAAFDALPTITLSFLGVHTALIPGITIKWSEAYEEWASKFRVTAFNGTQPLAQQVVSSNTGTTMQVWFDLSNYDKIVIEVLEWSHPYRRARTASVYLGIHTVYLKEDLLSFSHTQSVDLLSATLPKNEITFVLRNEDERWNPDNPVGAERYLLERQEIAVRYGMDVDGTVEWIEGGRFWLSAWNTPANGLEASFTARDILEFANEEYTGPLSGNLYSMANAAFAQMNLPILADGRDRYFVSGTLGAYSTDLTEGTGSQSYKISDILQMIAHMGCCVIYQTRDGVMHIEPRVVLVSDYWVDRNNSYSHPEFTISKPLKAVVVDYGDNQKITLSNSNSGEVQTISNAMIQTQNDAVRVGQAAVNLLTGRKTISGEYRADPRMDVLDMIAVQSKYSTNDVVVTDVTYTTTGGAFRGRFTGRAVF